MICRTLQLLCAFGLMVQASTAASSEVVDLSKEFGQHSGAFVLYDAGKDRWLRYRPEECRVRTSPCSTFKILNSLIALETGVATGPEFPLKWDGKKRMVEAWNQDQTLRSAFSISCVWYFQELARRIDLDRYEDILPKVGYGNADVSGGVTQFWLQSSLAISPDEQVEFLRRFHQRELPFSQKSVETVLDIMTLSKDAEVTLRGKTGTGMDPDSGKASLGWFVGIASSTAGDYYFATLIGGGEEPSGRKARTISDQVLRKLGVLPATE